jgi:hypothetical protein
MAFFFKPNLVIKFLQKAVKKNKNGNRSRKFFLPKIFLKSQLRPQVDKWTQMR